MDLPPIPDADWRDHQVQLFRESSARMVAPFEEAERQRAYRDQQSAQFAASSQALQQDLAGRLAGDQVAKFNQATQPIAAEVAKLTAPPQAPSIPTAGDVVGAVGKAVSGAAGDLVAYARGAAQRAGIDPDLFVRQINQESGFDPKAGSSAGAQGIAQIVPKYHPGVNPWNPTEALDYAANLMKSHLGTYGNYREALAAYNGGGGAVQQLRAGTPYDETRRYLGAILGGGPEPPQPAPATAGVTAQDAQQTPIRPNPATETSQPTFGVSAPDPGQFQGQVGMFDPAFGRYQPPLIAPAGVKGLSTPLGLGDVVSGAPAGIGSALGEAGRALGGAITRGAGEVLGTLDPEGQAMTREQRLARPLMEQPGAELGMGIAGGPGPEAVGGAGRLVGAAGRALTPLEGDVGTILNAAGEEIKRVAVRVPTPLKEEFLQPEALMPARSKQIVGRIVDRSRNVIAAMGDAGQELAGRVHQWREGWQQDAAAWIERMPTVRALGKPDFVNMVDVLEGNARPSSPRVAQAAAEAKDVLDDVFSRAQNAQVDVAERLDNYFPHTYKDEKIREMLETQRRGEMIKRVMDSGQAATPEEANKLMHRWTQGSARDRRQGSLEFARLANMPGYEKTKEALYNHIASASKRINEVAQFGQKDAIANRLIDRMGAEGYPVKVADDMFQTIVGAKNYDDLAQNISGIARAYNAVTRLGLAVVGNATQLGNTASVFGVLRTLQAAPKAAWSPADKAYARLTGVTLESILNEVREGGGWSDKIPGLSMLGFNTVEGANRRVTAIVGRDFAASMARRAAGTATGLERIGTRAGAVRALKTMGLDAEAIVRRGGVLTPEEEIRAGRNAVERTQFLVDPQDLPAWASHPLGKMLMQFKTFGYNQSIMFGREILAPLKHGNPLPLVRFAILAPLAQAAATETRNVLQGRSPEEDPQMRAIQYALGPLGLVGDLSRTIFGINSKYVPIERRTAQLTGSLLGPTAGTAIEALGAGLNATEGRLAPAARLGLRQIPYVGALAQNTLVPYKQPAETAGGPPATTRAGTRNTRGGGTRSGGTR